ncbi:MAG: hypothetical protein WAN60_06540 [Candidatus Sulfotelmatobacter sp.]
MNCSRLNSDQYRLDPTGLAATLRLARVSSKVFFKADDALIVTVLGAEPTPPSDIQVEANSADGTGIWQKAPR